MVTVSGLQYTYATGSSLRFPDFTIQRGQHALLLGESGSGKTTLLHVLGGLLRGYAGTVQINGTSLATLSEASLDAFRGKNIGFVFQKNHLITSLSVERNLLLAPFLAGVSPDRPRLEGLLTALDLQDKRHAQVTALSHGQAQRVAIARALMNHPPVILADEPTSALDDTNCERVMAQLLSMAAKNDATLIIATHDQRLKDRVAHHIHVQPRNT